MISELLRNRILLSLFVTLLAMANTAMARPISASETWLATNSPYTIAEDIVIEPGSMLTIQPGVVVNTMFDAFGSGNNILAVEFLNSGELSLSGTPLSPVSIGPATASYPAPSVRSVPTPCVYGLDMQGEALGVPCFFSDFIEGESLLGPMLAGEAWAEKLFIDTVCALQAVTEDALGKIAQELERISLADLIEGKYARLKATSFPLADAAYNKLKEEMPAPSALRFRTATYGWIISSSGTANLQA